MITKHNVCIFESTINSHSYLYMIYGNNTKKSVIREGGPDGQNYVLGKRLLIVIDSCIPLERLQ